MNHGKHAALDISHLSLPDCCVVVSAIAGRYSSSFTFFRRSSLGRVTTVSSSRATWTACHLEEDGELMIHKLFNGDMSRDCCHGLKQSLGLMKNACSTVT